MADPGFPRWDVNPFFENRMNMKKIGLPRGSTTPRK